MDRDKQISEMRSTLHACLSLFAEGHAISHFNWAASALNANDIRELNELPGKIRKVLMTESNCESERIHAENLARVTSNAYRRIEKGVARREKTIRTKV
jgi:hypothetical protein